MKARHAPLAPRPRGRRGYRLAARVPGGARAGALTARVCRCDQGAGNTPLHFAFGYKYVECGDFLRANGADDSLKNEDDETCYEIFKEDQEATAER